MGRVKNTMGLIRISRGKINTQFDMAVNNINDIRDNSNDDFDLIRNGFLFGYIQGMKAAKVE